MGLVDSREPHRLPATERSGVVVDHVGAKERPVKRLRPRATVVALAVVALGLVCALPSSAGVGRTSIAARPFLQQVDGGPGFYGRFPNPLPTDRGYFPVAVWGSYAHDSGNVAKDRAMGLNTYVWVADSSARYMANIRNAGMHVLQDVEKRENVGPETSGWLLSDEIDMTQGAGACPSALNARKARILSGHRGLLYDNYGRHLLAPRSAGSLFRELRRRQLGRCVLVHGRQRLLQFE